MRNFYAAATGGSTATAATFIVNETCEGTGTPASWTNVSTPNWDYTAVPLADAQSVYMATAAASVRARIDFTNVTEAWMYFLLRFTNGSLPAGNVSFAGTSPNGTAGTSNTLTLGATGRLTFGVSPTGTISADTTYHVWWHFKQGTGADAVADVGFSTNGVRPTSGANYAQATNRPETNLVGRLWLGPSAATLGYDVIFDNIRVAASQIGDNGTL